MRFPLPVVQGDFAYPGPVPAPSRMPEPLDARLSAENARTPTRTPPSPRKALRASHRASQDNPRANRTALATVIGIAGHSQSSPHPESLTEFRISPTDQADPDRFPGLFPVSELFLRVCKTPCEHQKCLIGFAGARDGSPIFCDRIRACTGRISNLAQVAKIAKNPQKAKTTNSPPPQQD